MNRFSKTVYLAILVFAMIFALVGCSTTAANVGTPDVTEPSVPATTETTEAPVEAPAEVEEVAEVVEEPARGLILDLEYAGFKATVECFDGYAYITYPSFVTDEELATAAAAAYAAYPQYLQGIFFEITEPGKATLTYPQGLTVADFEFASDLLKKEVAYYLDAMFAPAPEEPAVLFATVEILGEYTANIYCVEDTVVIEYPAVFSNDDVKTAGAIAYTAYSKYLDGTNLLVNDGVAVLTFPAPLAEEDFYAAISLIEKELPPYVKAAYTAALAALETPVVEEIAAVAEVIEEPVVEEPVVEEPVVETPAAEVPAETPAEKPAETPAEKPAETPAATTTTTSTPAATTSTPATSTPAAPATTAPAPEAAKKSNTGLIIVIIVLVIAAAAAAFIVLKKKKN